MSLANTETPQGHSMNTDKHPEPGPAVKKGSGKWTFHIFRIECEAGQYETQAAAKDARFKAFIDVV